MTGEPPFRFEVLNVFGKTIEPGAGVLLGTEDATLIPEGGKVMQYGNGGAGKTTLGLDLGFHLAAGDAWLDIPVPAPCRVGFIENEGPRPRFRKKVDKKWNGWQGSPIEPDRLHVFEEVWLRFDFENDAHRFWLARRVDDLTLDVVIVGPITALGMNEAGTIQQTREFQTLLDDVCDRAGRPVAFFLTHHENRAGKPSGAWEGTVDTLLHVSSRGQGYTRLLIEKARWASEYQGKTIDLAWTGVEGFEPIDRVEVDDATVETLIVAAVKAAPGCAWGKVEEAVPGVGAKRRRAIRDRLLRETRLVNVGKIKGELCTLTWVAEKRPARLYLPGHRDLDNLRPGPWDAADAE